MSASKTKMAPLQGSRMRDVGDRTRYPPIPDMEIPWEESAYAWRGYALSGHGDQSHERLCERGGFGIFEFMAFRKVADQEKADHSADGHWTHKVFEAEIVRVTRLSNAEVLAELRRGAPAPHCASCGCFTLMAAMPVEDSDDLSRKIKIESPFSEALLAVLQEARHLGGDEILQRDYTATLTPLRDAVAAWDALVEGRRK